MTLLAANFLKEFSAFERLDSAIRIGDAVICEKEFLDSLPRYKASNKPRYGNGVMRMCEVLYEDSSPQLLELIRRNWSVVLNHDKGAIAPDDVCEKINLWTKLLPFTPFLERLVKKTEHLSLARRCGMEINDGVDVRSSKAPKREEEYNRLFEFFERCGLFHGGNRRRELKDNSFWEFVILNRESETKRTDKEKETVPLSAHEEELQSIFFSLKESDAVQLSTVNANLEENNDDEELDDETNDNDGQIETEEERRAALNKLSTVKKYGICQTALQDIDLVGREMLGTDFREVRLRQREDRIKRIAQIHEAVAHFQSEAEIRRQRLQVMLVNVEEEDTESDYSWEVEYCDILLND
jgi:hypothetical protein